MNDTRWDEQQKLMEEKWQKFNIEIKQVVKETIEAELAKLRTPFRPNKVPKTGPAYSLVKDGDRFKPKKKD